MMTEHALLYNSFFAKAVLTDVSYNSHKYCYQHKGYICTTTASLVYNFFPKRKQDHKKKKVGYYYKNACIPAKSLFTKIYIHSVIHHLLIRILPKALEAGINSRQNVRCYRYF